VCGRHCPESIMPSNASDTSDETLCLAIAHALQLADAPGDSLVAALLAHAFEIANCPKTDD